MKITNASYRPVTIDWGSVTLPLKAGTPVSLSGQVANNGRAIGLVPQDVTEYPLISSQLILVAGEVSLREVETSYGHTLNKTALAAMSGIRFYAEDGTPVPDYMENQAASDTEIGGVLKAAAVASVPTGQSADAEDNAAAINAILAALKASGAMNLVTITTQPEGAHADPGDQASFSVVAVGTGLEYFWQYTSDPRDPESWSTVKDLGMSDWDQAELGPFEVTEELSHYFYRCGVIGYNGSAHQTVYTVTVTTKA